MPPATPAFPTTVQHRRPERVPDSASPDRTGLAAGLLTLVLLAVVQVVVKRPRLLLLDRFWPGSGWLEVILLSLYAGWLARKLCRARRVRQLRPLVWRVFSLVFFTQLVVGLSGLPVFLMTGKLHLPVPALILAGPLYRGGGYFMAILFASTVVLVGPAWCSWLCYIGSWDDFAARRRRRPAQPPRWYKLLRPTMLALVVVTALGLRLAGAGTAVAVAGGAAFGMLGVLVMAVFSRRSGLMVHCTTWCPIGLVAVVAGKLSPWRLRIGPACDACGACAFFCRYGALTASDLERRKPALTCTLCGDCLSACPARQIHYRFLGLGPAVSRSVFLALVVSLHAVFWGVARI